MTDHPLIIIEHPTRGILMDQDWDGEMWKTRFSWSKDRTEALPFVSRRAALTVIERSGIAGYYLLEKTEGSKWEKV